MVFHYRAILEKVKAEGLDLEQIDKMNALDNEDFFQFVLENSATNNI